MIVKIKFEEQFLLKGQLQISVMLNDRLSDGHRKIRCLVLLKLALLFLPFVKIRAQETQCKQENAFWGNYYFFNRPQLRQKSKKAAGAPAQEKFELADALIGYGVFVNTLRDESPQDTVKIYNADGSIWCEFSYREDNLLFFGNKPNSDLKPYYRTIETPRLFRVKSVSESWYEVVVNEETQMTKFMLGDDPMLGLTSVEDYLLRSSHVTFDEKANPLRETPNGKLKAVESSRDARFFLIVLKAIGWE